jgi:hypothetical protein
MRTNEGDRNTKKLAAETAPTSDAKSNEYAQAEVAYKDAVLKFNVAKANFEAGVTKANTVAGKANDELDKFLAARNLADNDLAWAPVDALGAPFKTSWALSDKLPIPAVDAYVYVA